MSSTYILAVICLLICLALFVLWQWRFAILTRLAARLQEDEVQTNLVIDIEAASRLFAHSGDYVSTPGSVINSLPTFKYTSNSSPEDSSTSSSSSYRTQKPASSKHQPCADSCKLKATQQQPGDDATDLSSRSSGASPSPEHHGGPDDVNMHQRQDLPLQDALQQPSHGQTGQPDQQQVSWISKLLHHQQAKHQQQRQSSASEPAVNADQSARGSTDTDNMQDQHMQTSQASLPQHQQHADAQDKASISSEGAETCVICLSAYHSGDLLKQLPCKHIYHAHCLNGWLHRSNTCPLCKYPVWQPATAAATVAGNAAVPRPTS